MENINDEIIGYFFNGIIYDLHSKNPDNSKPILKNSPFELEIIRHSCAHILAQAIKKYFNKYEINFAIGPITEVGFFYDFQIINEKNELISVSTHDLPKIEKEMFKIIDQNLEFKKQYVLKSEFEKINKDRLKSIVLQNINDERISIYTQGDSNDSFSDLCKGPHVLNSKIIGKIFKLTNVSEIFWKEQKLQRIEGICFNFQEELNNYLENKAKQIENDHKKIGKKMDLFSFNEIIPGFTFWHPKGLFLIDKIKQIIRKICYKGFEEYETPVLYKQELFVKTGHLQNYKENMFLLEDFCLKPMNCPAHSIIFKEKNLSYKQLPYRIAEFGSCFRNEEQGALNGLKRARKLTQDDGHIFCQIDHISQEIKRFLEDAKQIYGIFGFKNFKIQLATRPEKSIGNDEMWESAEDMLQKSLENYEYILAKGDGAFYGPKIELHLQDNLGRYWQCGTIQVDFFLSERLESDFMDHDNCKKYPIILHRAILGSIERFIGILLENGPLPFFLQPEQAIILPVSENFVEYSMEIQLKLREFINCSLNDNNETLGKKLKKALDSKIPYCLIIGQNELDNQTVTLRYNNENKEMKIDKLIDFFKDLIV